MKENINMFKEWYKLAKPNKTYFLFQLVTVIVKSITIVCEAMYIAKVTTSLTKGDYQKAIFCLILAFAFIWLRQLVMHLNYKNVYYLVGDTYQRIQKKIYNKIINSKDKNFTSNSQEKLINIFHSDTWEVANFADVICDKFCFLFSTILTVGYIFNNSIIIGLVVLIIIITNYIIVNKINKKISLAVKIKKDAIDEEFLTFNEIINSKNIIKNYNLEDKMAKRYAKANYKFLLKKDCEMVNTSYLDNFFCGYYKTLIFLITLVLISFLSHGKIELTVYFILFAYLNECIVSSNDFMGILTSLKNAYVSCNRVNIILNFAEFDSLAYGNVNVNDIKGEIDFLNVSYQRNSKDNIEIPEISNINIHIPSTKTVLFHGSRDCGKRTIFYLLNRNISQTSGEILVDKIKLENYNKKVYLKNINYITTIPYFYNNTILANLKLVCSKKSFINEMLEKVGLATKIATLPKGLKTNVNKLTKKEIYLLGIARLLLLNSEIIVLYEFPNYLNDKDKAEVIQVLQSLHNQKTILIFSANYDVKNIADQVFEIQNGQIKK